MMRLSLIAAVARNRVIGRDNGLVWHLPEDLKFFKTTTLGAPVITGRRNYESLPESVRPLPGRLNLVVTRNPLYAAPGAEVVPGYDEAVARAAGVPVSDETVARIERYMDALPPTTRSSLLIDLEAGKRIENDALAGDVVRLGRAHGVATPVMETLAAVLGPWTGGR